METEVRVREAMTPEVITISPQTTADKVAKLMAKNNIGSVIVVENKKPVGIVTERDICYHVVAKNKKPTEVNAKKMMSAPLKTVNPDATLTEASKIMARCGIRRLPVIENKSLIGILSDKDILAISPQTIEILKELSRINMGDIAQEPLKKEVPEKGTCEICGDYGVTLFEVDGIYACESCKEDKLGGE